MKNAGRYIGAVLAGLASAVVVHFFAFACAEGIAHELLALSRVVASFVYTACEGLFPTVAILVILIAMRMPLRVQLISACGAFLLFVVALPKIGLLFDTELVLAALLCVNAVLGPAMFIAILHRRRAFTDCEE